MKQYDERKTHGKQGRRRKCRKGITERGGRMIPKE
jgi:hypothetical protein